MRDELASHAERMVAFQMSDLVDPDRIEEIVGVKRHPTDHVAKAVSSDQTVYVLHSRECFDAHEDLRDCEYSKALDLGIDLEEWVEDEPVFVTIVSGRLRVHSA